MLAASVIYQLVCISIVWLSLKLLRGGSLTDIPTDGSGRVSVTDISNSPDDEGSGLLCPYQAKRYSPTDEFRWGVGERRRDLTLIPRPNIDTEAGTDYLGWVSAVVYRPPNLGMKLYRVPDAVAKENFFICSHRESHRLISVGILYQG